MEQKKIHIDNLYREKEEQFASLPSGAWDSMALRLNQHKRKRKHSYGWIWYVVFTALLLLIGYIIFKGKDNDFENDESQHEINDKTAHKQDAYSSKHFSTTSIKDEKLTKDSVKLHQRLREASSASKIVNKDVVNTNVVEKMNTDHSKPIKDVVAAQNDAIAVTPKADIEKTENSLATNTKKQKKNNTGDKVNSAVVEPVLNAKHNKEGIEVERNKKNSSKNNSANSSSNNNRDAVTKISENDIQKDAGKLEVIDRNRKETLNDVNGSEENILPEKQNIPKPEIADAKKSKKEATIEKKQLVTNVAAKNITNLTEDTVANSNQSTTINSRPDSLINSKVNIKTAKKKSTSKFEFGFKAGYETGVQVNAINKFVVAPYLQYNLSEKFAVAIQPGIRNGNASTVSVPASQAYYQHKGTTVDSQLMPAGGRLMWLYTFTQKYDSIIVSYQSQTKVTEFELPVILRYNLSNKFSLSVGVNFITGKFASITENKVLYQNMEQTDTFWRDANVIITDPPDTSRSFYHAALPITYYKNAGESAANNPLRVGYLLGVQYNHRSWLAEISLQQIFSGLSEIKNEKIKQGYAPPYFRFMIGYHFRK